MQKEYTMYYAPMCHLSGPAIRALLRKLHPNIHFITQMYSAQGILMGSTIDIIKNLIKPQELCKDTTIQLYASSNNEFVTAIKQLTQQYKDVKSVDLNLGCPAECASNKGYGFYYADNQLDLLQQCREENKQIELSAKIRLRPKEELLQFISQIVDQRYNKLIVHCRGSNLSNFSSQQEKPNYDQLAEILCQIYTEKSDIQNIEIVFNGGITSKNHFSSILQNLEQKYQITQKFNKISYMIGSAFLGNYRLGNQVVDKGGRCVYYNVINIQQFQLLCKMLIYHKIEGINQINNYIELYLKDSDSLQVQDEETLKKYENELNITSLFQNISRNIIYYERKTIYQTYNKVKLQFYKHYDLILLIYYLLECIILEQQSVQYLDLKEIGRHLHLLGGKIINSQEKNLQKLFFQSLDQLEIYLIKRCQLLE